MDNNRDTEIAKIHSNMVLKLSGHLAPGVPLWNSFKHLMSVHLNPVEVESLKSMFDVFTLLTTKGKIKYGEYEAVKNVFKAMEHMVCLQMVEKYEQEIKLTQHQHREAPPIERQPATRTVVQQVEPPLALQNQPDVPLQQRNDHQQHSSGPPNVQSPEQPEDRSELSDCMLQAFETLERKLDGQLQITVRRDHILPDLMQLYQSADILLKRLDVCFQGEDGQDAGGLTKDLFASFWGEAIQDFFQGENCVVPSLPTHRHGEATQIFKALGRALCHGIALTRSLPIKLSKSALCTLIYDEQCCDDVLLEDILMYMSERERVVTQKGLTSFDDLTSDEKDHLADMFSSRFKMQVLPSKDTFKQHILNIARNELITKPWYFLTLMRAGIPDAYMEEFFNRVTTDDIGKLYKRLRPKLNDVIRILQADHDPLRPEEDVVFYFLKDFIASLSPDDLVLFLQFVTGSDTMPSTAITVMFNREQGIRRHPVAHTCGNVLELPIQYKDLQEFKREFMTILRDRDAFRMNML